MARPDTNQFKSLLDSAHSVAILLPSHPGFDAVAAALSLKLSLDSSGKPTTVACPDPITVEFHRLVAADSIVSNFGSKNLVITFPGQTEIVDKISYNLDDHGELNLVITPKADTPGIDYRRLKFTAGGAQADLLILISNANLPKEYSPQTPQYRLDDPLLSQSAAQILADLHLPVNVDTASNLLAGLEQATNNFQNQSVTADTFEVAAHLLRLGARRHDTASLTDFPAGSIPVNPSPVADTEAQPSPDWFAPKVFSGTTVS